MKESRGQYHVIELSPSSALSAEHDEGTKEEDGVVQDVRSPLYADESGVIATASSVIEDTTRPLGDEEVQSTATVQRLNDDQQELSGHVTQQFPSLKCIFLNIIIGIIFLIIIWLFVANNNLIVQQKQGFTSTKMSLEWGNLAFGSCTSYDLREWSIFTDAIVPLMPDAWIWAGDFVYLDDPDMDCNSVDFAVTKLPTWQTTCNCSGSWLTTPPFSCHAGDVEYIRNRWQWALNNAPYNAFLDYMCPMARTLGLFPPPGTNNKVCKPLIGMYDDHDFGWNNGNRRLPHKDTFKNMFLDAIGESQHSPRRGPLRGAWGKYTLNEGLAAGIHIDVFLLDERYERDPLPCDTRRAYCEDVVLMDTTGTYNHERAFCQDFLYGGSLGQGTCCDKDEKIFFGWCRIPANIHSPLWREACDVSYELFGHRSLFLNHTGGLEVKTGSGSGHGGGAFSEGTVMDVSQESSFCDVLGREQRQWLRQAIKESTAAVKVFVSPSVLLANPLPTKCGTKTKTKTKSTSTPSGTKAMPVGKLDSTITPEVAIGADTISEVLNHSQYVHKTLLTSTLTYYYSILT